LAGNQPLENVQTYLRGRLCVGLHNFQVFIHFVLPSVPERSRNLEGTIPNARESQNRLELYARQISFGLSTLDLFAKEKARTKKKEKNLQNKSHFTSGPSGLVWGR